MHLHLRSVTRLQVIAALVLFTVFYLVWVFPNLHVRSRIAKAWVGKQRKIVVFGDSFSDTTNYLLDVPEERLRVVRDPEEGQKWVEVLCSEIVCDAIDNFARSYPLSDEFGGIGAVIHGEIYANATFQSNETITELLPDLRKQVQQWINVEKQRAVGETDDEYVFTVFFGQWDLWQYATLSRAEAQNAISCSLYELFNQLDIIAERSLTPPRIIVPSIWDLTFVPRFVNMMYSNITSEQYAGEQHKMIFLVKFWNNVLLQMARKWPRGDIFVPDWNSWMLEEIRNSQLSELGIQDATGLGTKTPSFKDVYNPCIIFETNSSTDELVEKRCEHPPQHLFWDDMHFGETAHRTLGQQVAELLASNETTNSGARKENIRNGNSGNKLVTSAETGPTLAPGYR